MRKRFFGILAALCLCLTLLPAAALADDSNLEQPPLLVSSWVNLRDTLTNSTEAVINAQLTQGITWEEGSIVIPAGKTVTLNLPDGCNIDAKNSGTAIQVRGNLIINGNQNGMITQGAATDGSPAGGIYIAPGGRVTMNGGMIANCSAGTQTATGVGGVYVSEGATFEMNAGYITQCSGGNESNLLGSPHAASVLNKGIFTINNSASIWDSKGGSLFAGIVLYNSGTFNANGGSIGTNSSDNQLVCNANTGTIQNSRNNTTTIYSTVYNSGVISGGTFNGAVSNQEGGKIKGGSFTTLDGYKYSVTVTLGQYMHSSDALTQSGLLLQNMKSVVVTANDGYCFPAGYTVPEKDGVKVTRNSASQVTVSGMPCYNVNITLPDAAAKTQTATPSAVFTATGSDTGTLTNVDSDMQYSLDGSNWTNIHSSSANLTGLTSSTEIQIIKRGGDTAFDSDIQRIALTQAATPTAAFAATGTSTGTLTGVTPGMQYQIGSGAWTNITGENADLTRLSGGIVIRVRTTGGGTTLFSQSQEIPVNQADTPEAVFTAAGTSTGTLSNVTAGMKYKIGDGEWTPISSNDAVSLTGLSACTISIMRSDGQKLDSKTQTISVTKPNAPKASAQNCINGNDGKLTGVNNAMEYRRTDTTTWTAVTGSEVTGLAAGSYEVRCKANGAALASEPQTVTIGSYAAQLTKSNGGVSYYASLKEAVDAAKNNSGSIVKLLQDINVKAYSLVIEGCKKTFTIDLNGKTLSTDISDEIPGNLVFYLKNNDADAPLTLINSASTQAVIQSQRAFHIQFSGSVIIGKPDGSDSNIKFELSTMLATGSENTGSITIYGGTFECPVNVSTAANAGVAKVTLYGGIFSEIGVAAPATLVGTLAEGYGFRKDNAWVNQLDGTELTGVTVQQAPIEAFTLTADKTTADYGEEITLTASVHLRDEEKTAAYQWFKDGEPVNTTESSYGIAALTAGDHKITCTVSCDGYSTSKSVDLKVNKVDSQITPPAAMENLVYTGKEQALITAGTAVGGTMQYCLTQDGTYSKNVPIGKNAGSYTVWYKAIGDGNHNDSAPASVSVTIARQPVNVPGADATVFTYDGEKKTYTIAANDNYTVANAEQTNAGTYTVTVTLKDAENFVWNDKTDAAKGYTFIIARAKVTVTIQDKTVYVDSKTAPDLSKPEEDKDYTISGLIGEDTLSGEVKLKYNPATPDLTKVSDMTRIVDNGSTLANSNYDVTYVEGKLTVTHRPSSGSSSSGSSTVKTETTKNDDGSTTKTETKKDGTVIQTTTGKDGSVTKTETKPDGSSVTESKTADGSTGTVKTDKNGQTEAAAKVSGKAVEDAKKNGEAVKVPVLCFTKSRRPFTIRVLTI